MTQYTFCPLCVDYFADIKSHHYEKHDKKLTDFKSENGIQTLKYDLVGLDLNMRSVITK